MLPRELAAMLSIVARDHGWDSEEALYRATLNMLGLKRLNTNVSERLTAALPLALDEQSV